jgi:hypothetical protein
MKRIIAPKAIINRVLTFISEAIALGSPMIDRIAMRIGVFLVSLVTTTLVDGVVVYLVSAQGGYDLDALGGQGGKRLTRPGL